MTCVGPTKVAPVIHVPTMENVTVDESPREEERSEDKKEKKDDKSCVCRL